jgi:hypothetical protein
LRCVGTFSKLFWNDGGRTRTKWLLIVEDKEIADDVEWWLVLIIVLDHFKEIGEAIRVLQGRALMVKGQLEKLEQLRDQIAEMHCIAYRSGIDGYSRPNSKSDEFSLLVDVEDKTTKYQGSALLTVVVAASGTHGSKTSWTVH